MKNISTAVLLLLLFSQSFAGDFDKGLDAYLDEDFATALKYYRPMAEQGDAAAQALLGLMYEKGNGVIKDPVYAHMWYNISASLGDENASKNRDSISKRMTPEQIAKAQDLARECVKKNYKGC